MEPKKIVICHVDVDFDLDYLRPLLDLGVCLGFDNFGKEFYIDADDRGFAGGIFARDLERVQVIRQLVARAVMRVFPRVQLIHSSSTIRAAFCLRRANSENKDGYCAD